MQRFLASISTWQLGRCLLVALVLTLAASMALKSAGSDVRNGLLSLRPRLSQDTQELMTKSEPPQAFLAARSPEQARNLLADIDRAGSAEAPRAAAMKFHHADLAFIACYIAAMVIAALWTCQQAVACLGRRESAATFAMVLCSLGILGALIALISDWIEYRACTAVLRGTIEGTVVMMGDRELDQDFLRQTAWASDLKWVGAGLGAVVFVIGVVMSLTTDKVQDRLRNTWSLTAQAIHFAMKARFSVLAAAVFTFLMLTHAGRDIIRNVATGSFSYEVTSLSSNSAPRPDLARLGWFAVALLTLAGTCWAWARLVLAVRFDKTAPQPGGSRTLQPHESGPGEAGGSGLMEDGEPVRNVEDRLRRDLPIHYGAVPLVAAACAFAVAPVREMTALRHPIAQLLAGALPTLFVFFVLPLILVVIRPKSSRLRHGFGPLSLTLAIYTVLALVIAFWNVREIGVIGLTPTVLLLVALFLFGLGRPRAILILPVFLLVATAMHWPGWAAFRHVLWPVITLFLIGYLAARGVRMVKDSDSLHIPEKFGTGQLLRLIFSDQSRVEIVEKISNDKRVVAELERQHHSSSSAEAAADAAGPGAEDRAPPSPPDLPAHAVRRLQALLRLCFFCVVLQAVHFIAVLYCPLFASHVGSAAILALGLAAWTTAGAALIFLTQASRFPILGTAIVIGILCSAVMDNHQIRLVPGVFLADRDASTGTPGGSARVGQEFKKWRGRQDAGAQAPCCIIVAAEGGGIRAAMWPAIVLSSLQDLSAKYRGDRPDFTSHVFAISGVSGGSMGAAAFTAVCEDDQLRSSQQVRAQCARLCGQDYLAPTLGALLYPDALQRFLPFKVFEDRASYFERAWEESLLSKPGEPRRLSAFGKPMGEVWKRDGRPWLPALFLNATMVETGQRAIASHLSLCTSEGGEFIDAHDLHCHLREFGPGAGRWQEVSLATAAHASARFPLVSPPGRLPSGARIVDGGYFENSGATTALDLIHLVKNHLDTTSSGGPAPKVILLLLRYENNSAVEAGDSPPPVPDEEPHLYPDKNFLNETGGILGTVLATREARGSYARHAIADHRKRYGVEVVEFTFRGLQIPLSWTLSQRSCSEMLRQFPMNPWETHVPEKGEDPLLTATIQANAKKAGELLGLLYPDAVPRKTPVSGAPQQSGGAAGTPALGE